MVQRLAGNHKEPRGANSTVAGAIF